VESDGEMLQMESWIFHMNLLCVMQYIEADDLEPATNDTHPVRYHEAWQQLCSCDGVLVPGGFGHRGIEGKILAAEWARTAKKPYLGTCLVLLMYNGRLDCSSDSVLDPGSACVIMIRTLHAAV